MYRHIAKIVSLGSNSDQCYIQNRVVTNHVIRRSRYFSFFTDSQRVSFPDEKICLWVAYKRTVQLYRTCEMYSFSNHHLDRDTRAPLYSISFIHMSHLVENQAMWFPNRSDTNRPVQAQKRARSLKFRI